MTIGLPLSPTDAMSGLTRVAKRYTLIESEGVKEFLLTHPNLEKTLLDAVPEIEGIFGDGTSLSLQVLVDHDGDDDKSLFARIQTSLGVREALHRKKRLYREWWMKQPHVTQMPLTFDVECL